jgi:chemotaxis protein methyltransferase CheR
VNDRAKADDDDGDDDDALLRMLRERAGLRFPKERLAAVLDATRRAMDVDGARDVPHYVARIAAGQASFADLVEQVTVGETYFFRDPDQFVYLEQHVIPELLTKAVGRPIRVWSAACASGEEAYTLAMSFQRVAPDRATVLGTDISRKALVKARAAHYGRWSLRDAGADTARRYLTAERDGWTVEPAIRRNVRFKRLNLVADPYPGPSSGEPGFDLVLCRNVLIYLDPDSVAHVARSLFESLAVGGWLFTAASDPPLRDHAPFEHVVTASGVYYRRPEAAPDVAVASPASAPHVPNGPTPRPRSRAAPPSSARRRTPAPARRRPERTAAVPESAPAPASRVSRSPMSAESHYLQAVALIDQRKDDEAAAALERALYLDRRMVAAHFALGLLRERQGDAAAARRALRNARRLCAELPPETPIPFAGGTCASQLASMVRDLEAALAAPERRR